MFESDSGGKKISRLTTPNRAEVAIATDWSAKLEYLYYSFGNVSGTFPSGTAYESKIDVQSLRVGLNRQLDWGSRAGLQAGPPIQRCSIRSTGIRTGSSLLSDRTRAFPFALSGTNSHFSAWIGLIPKQHSSGGRERLGSISKQGDRYLRILFVGGALAVIRYAKHHGTIIGPGLRGYWLDGRPKWRPSRLPIACSNGLGTDGQE